MLYGASDDIAIASILPSNEFHILTQLTFRPQARKKPGLYVKVLGAVVVAFLLGVAIAVTVALVVLRSDSSAKSSSQKTEMTETTESMESQQTESQPETTAATTTTTRTTTTTTTTTMMMIGMLPT